MKHTKLGQHFLTRPEIAGWVANAVPLSPNDVALEIGPGHGILTRELLKQAGKVVAIEKDVVLAAELRETFASDIAGGKLTILEQDIRDFDPDTLLPTPYVLTANIPYYITGYIIRKFLTASHQPTNMTLLVQKEVAQRIVAANSKGSVLSNSVYIYGTPHLVHTVKAGAFSPPPKVDSAVLAITDISREKFSNTNEEEQFFKILRAGFSSKRKFLSNNLKDLVSPESFEHCNIPKKARAEELSPEQWLALTQAHIAQEVAD